MRRLVVLLLCAVPALAGELESEIRAVLEGLRVPGAGRTSFDMEGLLELLQSRGVKLPTDPAEREGLRLGLELGAGQGFVDDVIGSFERLVLRSVEPSGDGSSAIAVADFFSDDGECTRARVHLRRVGGRWRIFDLEDLFIGTRLSELIGEGIAVTGGRLDVARIMKMTGMAEAAALIEEGELEEAEQRLRKAADAHLPPAYEAMRCYTLANLRFMVGDHEEALALCDQAARLKPDMAGLYEIRALIADARDEPEAAIAHARRFVEIAGPEAGVMEVLADALIELGRKEEAIPVALAGLEQDPDYYGNLASLALALPKDRKGEIDRHFARARDVVQAVDVVADWCAFSEDWDALAAVLAVMRERCPAHPYAAYHEAQLLLGQGKNDEAVAVLRKSLRAESDWEIRGNFLRLYAEAIVAVGRPAEGFLALSPPDRAWAFEDLADLLATNKSADALEQVVRARAADPDTGLEVQPWRAEVHWLRGEHEKVVAILGRHEEALMGSDAIQYRWYVPDRLFRSLMKLGRFDDALAAARRSSERDADSSFLVFVHAARGETEQAMAAFRHSVEVEECPAAWFYEDEDFAHLLQGAAYAALREDYPPDGD